jgi:hypothetical protein
LLEVPIFALTCKWKHLEALLCFLHGHWTKLRCDCVGAWIYCAGVAVWVRLNIWLRSISIPLLI